MRRRISERKPLFIIPVVLAIITLLSFIVMTLWNNILVPVVHAGMINFWQALGIFILAKILFGFGGFRGGWGRHRHNRHKIMEWQNNMFEKWQSMTPEEREKFKQRWDKRCYGWKEKFPAETTQEGTE